LLDPYVGLANSLRIHGQAAIPLVGPGREDERAAWRRVLRGVRRRRADGVARAVVLDQVAVYSRGREGLHAGGLESVDDPGIPLPADEGRADVRRRALRLGLKRGVAEDAVGSLRGAHRQREE